MKLITFNTKK